MIQHADSLCHAATCDRNTTRDDQKFNIEFVAIVKKHPVIYDYKQNEYCKKHVIEKVWAEISAEVQEKLKENCSGKGLFSYYKHNSFAKM
jgi:leucyl-tRNA synthetase